MILQKIFFCYPLKNLKMCVRISTQKNKKVLRMEIKETENEEIKEENTQEVVAEIKETEKSQEENTLKIEIAETSEEKEQVEEAKEIEEVQEEQSKETEEKSVEEVVTEKEIEEKVEEDIKFDFSGMRAENFEDPKHGVSYKDIMKISQKVDLVYYNVMDNESREAESYFDLVRNPQDLDEIQEYANYVAENFENFVVLGIGGSALGARALFSALTTMDYKKCDIKRNKRPNWFVRDSICPEKFACLLDSIDVKKTMFCVVTKSGGTLETLIQLNLVIEKLQGILGDDYKKNICAITSNLDGKLNKWAIENDIKTFYFGNDVSGRFSVFSAVGLLPAAVVGADIKRLLAGANKMLERCRSLKFFENPALYGATLQKIAMDKGCNISYLMPYSDNLKIVAEWYCQLCAESLGKKEEKACRTKHVGLTPVKALGTVDQHSQMQLCLEGPYDKFITFIRVNKHDNDVVVPRLNNGLLDDYICGNKISDILNTSQKATEKALLECNRLSRTIEINELNEYAMGELLMFFMIETSFLGALLDVNAYNQPSVELIKTNIKKFLNEEETLEGNNESCEKCCCCECDKKEEAIEPEQKEEKKEEQEEVVTELVLEPQEENLVADDDEVVEQIVMPEVEKLEVVVENTEGEQNTVLEVDEPLEGQQQFVIELEEEKVEEKPQE